MRPSQTLGGGAMVATWERLDRGWQATLLGLALVAMQALAQLP
jgi:hypothetical protein